MENNISSKIEDIKKEIQQKVLLDDEIVCSLCNKLIDLAQQNNDMESITYGYVWRAEYFFYALFDLNNMAIELGFAQKYIDEKSPSVLLEKYYTLQHLLHKHMYDIQVSFQYCLKGLGVAQEINLVKRIAAQYGNIGSFYLDYDCYEEALYHTNKAIEFLHQSTEDGSRVLRILLVNAITIYLKLGKYNKVREYIEELANLPIESQDLDIYVNYTSMLYYSALRNLGKSIAYLGKMLEDKFMQSKAHLYIIEMTQNVLESLLFLKKQTKAKQLLEFLGKQLLENEYSEQLILCKLQIKYAMQYQSNKEINMYYKKYYNIYSKVKEQSDEMKIGALRAQVKINDINFEDRISKTVLQDLKRLAEYDALTQVYNRRYLNIKQNEIVNNTQNKFLGFIIVDIDYFKEYNDNYGHLKGDETLKAVAQCLAINTNEQIDVFRYGGDEFVCLCKDTTYAQMEQYIKNAQASLKEKNIEHKDSRCSKIVTLSIGYGIKPIENQKDAFLLFNEVDDALYAAKYSGRNTAKSIVDIDPSKGEKNA